MSLPKLKYAVCGEFHTIAWFFDRAVAEEYAAWLRERGQIATVAEDKYGI